MKRWASGLLAILITVSVLSLHQAHGIGAETPQSPIVGSWRRISGEAGVNVTALFTFFADGTVISTDRDGVTWHGAWQTVSEDQVALTIEAVNEDSTGMGQSVQFSLGTDHDSIPFGSDSLQRITPESS